jgi:1-acyl-sn-glycerol-3-phosphate acyltransferase
MKMADYIIVDRGDDESKAAMLEKSLKWLVNGVSVMIFPEGTRSKDQETGFFKRGAFQLAIDARVPILPMVIDGAGDILPKHGFFIKGNNKITLRVLDPVPPSAFNTKNPEELALKFRELINTNLNELRKDGL